MMQEFVKFMKKPSKKDLKKWEKMALGEIAEWKKFLKDVRNEHKRTTS